MKNHWRRIGTFPDCGEPIYGRRATAAEVARLESSSLTIIPKGRGAGGLREGPQPPRCRWAGRGRASPSSAVAVRAVAVPVVEMSVDTATGSC